MDPPIPDRVKRESCCQDGDIGTEELEATVDIIVKLEFEEIEIKEEELSCNDAAGVDEVVEDERDVEEGENEENDRETGVNLLEIIERDEEQDFGDGEI